MGFVTNFILFFILLLVVKGISMVIILAIGSKKKSNAFDVVLAFVFSHPTILACIIWAVIKVVI